MCKSGFTLLLLIVAAIASVTPPLGDNGYTYESRGSFTDQTLYNAADHAGNPLGWLERDTLALSFNLAYNFWKRSEDTTTAYTKLNGFTAPVLRVGQPHMAYFQVSYTPAILHRRGENNFNSPTNLPLHRFGFALVGGLSSGYLQAGLSGDGYYGKAYIDNANDLARVLLGVGGVYLYLGSQVHPLVRFGFSGGADGYVDTLFQKGSGDNFQDRFFSGRLPVIGGFLDFGRKDFPVLSNFRLNWAVPRFVYVAKGALLNNQKPGGNEDVITGDSLGWDWQSIGNIPGIAGMFDIHPAFTIGQWNVNTQLYTPSDDNNPIHYGPALTDSTWKISSFDFGLGLSADLWKNHSMWLEYSHTAVDLTYGNAFSTWTGHHQAFDNFRIGASSSIGAFTALSLPEKLNLKLRTGFYTFEHNTAYPSEPDALFGLMHEIRPGSNLFRYNPEKWATGKERINGFSAGCEAGYLPYVNGAFDMSFFSNDKDMSGMQFGAYVTLMLMQGH